MTLAPEQPLKPFECLDSLTTPAEYLHIFLIEFQRVACDNGETAPSVPDHVVAAVETYATSHHDWKKGTNNKILSRIHRFARGAWRLDFAQTYGLFQGWLSERGTEELVSAMTQKIGLGELLVEAREAGKRRVARQKTFGRKAEERKPSDLKEAVLLLLESRSEEQTEKEQADQSQRAGREQGEVPARSSAEEGEVSRGPPEVSRTCHDTSNDTSGRYGDSGQSSSHLRADSRVRTPPSKDRDEFRRPLDTPEAHDSQYGTSTLHGHGEESHSQRNTQKSDTSYAPAAEYDEQDDDGAGLTSNLEDSDVQPEQGRRALPMMIEFMLNEENGSSPAASAVDDQESPWLGDTRRDALTPPRLPLDTHETPLSPEDDLSGLFNGHDSEPASEPFSFPASHYRDTRTPPRSLTMPNKRRRSAEYDDAAADHLDINDVRSVLALFDLPNARNLDLEDGDDNIDPDSFALLHHLSSVDSGERALLPSSDHVIAIIALSTAPSGSDLVNVLCTFAVDSSRVTYWSPRSGSEQMQTAALELFAQLLHKLLPSTAIDIDPLPQTKPLPTVTKSLLGAADSSAIAAIAAGLCTLFDRNVPAEIDTTMWLAFVNIVLGYDTPAPSPKRLANEAPLMIQINGNVPLSDFLGLVSSQVNVEVSRIKQDCMEVARARAEISSLRRILDCAIGAIAAHCLNLSCPNERRIADLEKLRATVSPNLQRQYDRIIEEERKRKVDPITAKSDLKHVKDALGARSADLREHEEDLIKSKDSMLAKLRVQTQELEKFIEQQHSSD